MACRSIRNAHVADLSVGERQRIEIVRALLQNPKLIILDEPTSVLTPQEADRLFETLNKLKAEGRSVLYISHRLEEVQRICDRATVLAPRQGHRRLRSAQGNAGLAGTHDGRQRCRAMSAPRARAPRATVQLEARNLSVAARTPFAVSLKNDLSQGACRRSAGDCRRCGQRAGRALRCAVRRISGGSDDVDPHRAKSPSATRGINARRLLGAGFVPEERHGHAAVSAMTLSDNLVLARSQSDRKAFLGGGLLGIIRQDAVKTATKRISRSHGRAQERRGSAGRLAVGRQPAEIHRRPRARPPAGGAGRQPADLGRRCRCCEPHPPGARRSRQEPARPCWSSARISTRFSKSRPRSR